MSKVKNKHGRKGAKRLHKNDALLQAKAALEEADARVNTLKQNFEEMDSRWRWTRAQMEKIVQATKGNRSAAAKAACGLAAEWLEWAGPAAE